jgi:hypothetical protein
VRSAFAKMMVVYVNMPRDLRDSRESEDESDEDHTSLATAPPNGTHVKKAPVPHMHEKQQPVFYTSTNVPTCGITEPLIQTVAPTSASGDLPTPVPASSSSSDVHHPVPSDDPQAIVSASSSSSGLASSSVALPVPAAAPLPFQPAFLPDASTYEPLPEWRHPPLIEFVGKEIRLVHPNGVRVIGRCTELISKCKCFAHSKKDRECYIWLSKTNVDRPQALACIGTWFDLSLQNPSWDVSDHRLKAGTMRDKYRMRATRRGNM